MSGSAQPVTQSWRAAEPRYPPHAMSYPVQITRPHAVRRETFLPYPLAGQGPRGVSPSGLGCGCYKEIRPFPCLWFGISSFLSRGILFCFSIWCFRLFFPFPASFWHLWRWLRALAHHSEHPSPFGFWQEHPWMQQLVWGENVEHTRACTG